MHRPQTLLVLRNTLLAAIGVGACQTAIVQPLEPRQPVETREVPPALAVTVPTASASSPVVVEPPPPWKPSGFVSDLHGPHRVHGEQCAPLTGPHCVAGDWSEECDGRRGVCATDDDCPSSDACHCGENGVGLCIAASCHSDDDCGPSKGGARLCAFYVNPGSCGSYPLFVCRTAADTCVNSGDCKKSGERCLADATNGFQCGTSSHCMRGRPLYVEAVPQVATLRAGDRWNGPRRFDLRALPASDRRALAEKARTAALDEHASIAAFARTIAELMALGAPPDLLFATQKALGEEIRHAQDTFALASIANGGEETDAAAAREPGHFPAAIAPFATESTLASDLASSVFRGGCLGEAAAALAAHADAEATPLPDLRAFYEELAAEEASHAALAWQTLDWLWDLPGVPGTIAKAFANLPEDRLRSALVEPLLAAIAGKRSGAEVLGIRDLCDVEHAGS